MTATATRYDSVLEERVLEDLRLRYEGLGYRFIVHPDTGDLPDFFRGYVPDAVALGASANIAIEVVAGPSPRIRERIGQLQDRLNGHDDWRVNVVYGGQDPLPEIDLSSMPGNALDQELQATRNILGQGHPNAALIMGFALLEALAAAKVGPSRPLKPGTVVQALTTDGLIGQNDAKVLLDAIPVRNRIVHGDLTTRTSGEQVEAVLDIIEAVLKQ